jgi:hypothetical protein
VVLVTAVQTVDLAAWRTQPCPRCGQDAKTLRIESFEEDDILTAPTRVEWSRRFNVEPCGHAVSGYTVQDDRVEWMPYV